MFRFSCRDSVCKRLPIQNYWLGWFSSMSSTIAHPWEQFYLAATSSSTHAKGWWCWAIYPRTLWKGILVLWWLQLAFFLKYACWQDWVLWSWSGLNDARSSWCSSLLKKRILTWWRALRASNYGDPAAVNHRKIQVNNQVAKVLDHFRL